MLSSLSAMYIEQTDVNGRSIYFKHNGTTQRRIANAVGARAIAIQNTIQQSAKLDVSKPVLPIVDAILKKEATQKKQLTDRQIVTFARNFNAQTSSSSSSSTTNTTTTAVPFTRKRNAKRQRSTSPTAQTTTLAASKQSALNNAPTKKQRIVAPFAGITPFVGLMNNANYCFANAALQGIACVQNTLHSPHCTCNLNMHNQLWNATQQIAQHGDNAYDARNFINATAQELQIPGQYDDSAQFIRRFFQRCAQHNCTCFSNILFSTIFKADYDQGDDAIRDMIDQQLCGSVSAMLVATQQQVAQFVQHNVQKQRLIESRYAPVLMIECPGQQKIQPREQLQFNFVNAQQKTYTLRSILLYNGGHYTALVRYGNSWFLCNDATISNGHAIFNELLTWGRSGYFRPRMLIYTTNNPTPTQAQIAQWTLHELPPIIRNDNNFAQQLLQTNNDSQREILIKDHVQQLIINGIQQQIQQNQHLIFCDYLTDQGQVRTFLNANALARAAIITAFNADLTAKTTQVTHVLQTMQDVLPQNQHQTFIDHLTTHRGAINTFINGDLARRTALINNFLNPPGQWGWGCSIL